MNDRSFKPTGLLKSELNKLPQIRLVAVFLEDRFSQTFQRELERVNTLEKLDLFHSIEVFFKYCRKRLENPISIVLSNSIVWKRFSVVWKYFRNSLEVSWK